MTDKATLQIERLQMIAEFDKLMFRKRRLNLRLDRLAAEIEENALDIAIESLRENYTVKPVERIESVNMIRMEMI